MNISIDGEKKIIKRKRKPANKRWLPSDEASIIDYLKRNRNFEKPVAQVYYNKFIKETNMEVEWKIVRAKVRNMRMVYLRAKEYENTGVDNDLGLDLDSVKDVMLKICWYIDDFDELFPYKKDEHINITHSSGDDSSNHDSVSNSNSIFNSTLSINEECLLEPTVNLASKSIKRDILAVQTGMFNFKRQKHDEDNSIRQQELQLMREKIIFEKEKFREEIRVKEKEIETQEKLKIMELQMKERVAMKELELKERIALKPMGKHENYDNLYHQMT